MKRRSHRRNLVVWNSSAGPAGSYGAPRSRRPARTSRIRWWIRTGVLFAVIGLMHLPRAVRTHWRPVVLLSGSGLTVAGVVVSSAAAFIPGVLVLLLGLRIPSDSSMASVDPALMPFLVDARPDRPAPR